jgi:hypothetical protein
VEKNGELSCFILVLPPSTSLFPFFSSLYIYVYIFLRFGDSLLFSRDNYRKDVWILSLWFEFPRHILRVIFRLRRISFFWPGIVKLLFFVWFLELPKLFPLWAAKHFGYWCFSEDEVLFLLQSLCGKLWFLFLIWWSVMFESWRMDIWSVLGFEKVSFFCSLDFFSEPEMQC